MMDSITKMVGVIETALLNIEEITQPSSIDMLYALQDRLEAARAEVDEVHRYLDECFVNDPDEGRAVPLIDRVVLLVSQIARDNGEAASLAGPEKSSRAQDAQHETAIVEVLR